MGILANRKFRIVFVCGTLVAFGALSRSLPAQEAEAQATSGSDISNFNVFLDAHADIDAQLRANPSLLTNAEFLVSHPQLENYLNQHPAVQTAIKENPSYFMEREKRLAAREIPRDTNPNPDLNRHERERPVLADQTPRYTNVNPDLNRQEVDTMDQFLDKNPVIERELWRSPSLVNDTEYLEAHPRLQAFLSQHPNVKEEIAENPRYFIERENRFNAQELQAHEEPTANSKPSTNSNTRANSNANGKELAEMDQFLDEHPRIERELWRHPSLVNNAEYLQAHPALQAFLERHPNAKQEIAQNPRYAFGARN
jgi:phage-related protein